MPPFFWTSKALSSILSRKNGFKQLIRSGKSNGHLSKLDQCLCSSAIAGNEKRFIHRSLNRFSESNPFTSSLHFINAVQKRQFLGCGDGEEGVLSKIYEERRVLGYHDSIPICVSMQAFFLFFFSFYFFFPIGLLNVFLECRLV